MRMIGTIATDTDAERFSDYLLAQGMPNMVEESSTDGAWQVWVEHDDDLDRAKAELQEYLRGPEDPKYIAAVSHAEKIRKEEEKKQERLKKQHIDVRTRWSKPKSWAVPLTLALIILSVIVSLMTGSVGLGQERSGLIDYLLFTSVAPPRVEAWEAANPEIESETQFLAGYWWTHLRTGQVWRVITPIFLHWSILHLVFNMFWTRDLGAMIEAQRGTLRLLGIVLASALISNTAQYFWDGPRFGGMSGVVYALFGYIWVKQRFEPHLGMGLSQQTVWIMVAWLVLAMTGIVGSNIANTAHVVGLLVGATIGYGPVAARKMKQARRRLE